MKKVSIQSLTLGDSSPLVVICGPCVMEGESFVLKAAETLKKIFSDAGCGLIFKSSYDKANRSAKDAFRGPGIQEGLRILERVKKEFALPVITDVHAPEEASAAGEVCDCLQIPAFLCRQTDLILAAAKTGAVINIKKGQFLAPWDMKQAIDKVLATGNEKIICTERGTSFGYNNLVSDMRSIPIMQSLGFPVCFDATHSVQLPGKLGGQSGGQREFVPVLAKAALAAGADALFMEAHPDPVNAKSDAACQIPFEDLRDLLPILKNLHELMHSQ